MKHSVVMTVREVNKLIIDHVAKNNPHMTAAVFNVEWDLCQTPPTVTITEC